MSYGQDTGGIRRLLTVDTAGRLATAPVLYDGTTSDYQRGNVVGIALPALARTASNNSDPITNYNGRGVVAVMMVSAVTGTPSIVVTISAYDAPTGLWVPLAVGNALTVPGGAALTLYPGIPEVAGNTVSFPLPRTFRFEVVHANADPITYSISYNIIL